MPQFERVLLYIGAPKTGTTSNQAAVLANRDALARHGVFVPRAGQRGGQHLDLAATVPNRLHGGGLDRHADINGGNLARRRAAFLRALHAELAAAPQCDTLLMMSEYLLNATPHDIECFQELFAPYAPRLECLMYLRRQDQWLASLALQARKSGTRQDFDLDPGQPGRYGAKIRGWHGAVDACHIRRFDPAYFVDGDLAADFRVALGVGASAFPNESPTANPSIMQEQLELIDVLNRKLESIPFHKRISIRRTFVGFCEETVGGTRIEFARDTAVGAFRAYVNINRWLRETLDPEGPPLFFPEDFSQYPTQARNDRRYDLDQLIRLAEALDGTNAARGLPQGGWRPGDGREAIIEAIIDAFILMRKTALGNRQAPAGGGQGAGKGRGGRRKEPRAASGPAGKPAGQLMEAP